MAVLGMNEGTEKFINFDLSGTVNTQVVAIGYGTVNTVGTLGVVQSLSAGTITKVEGGTVNRIETIGTVEVATITTLPNLPQGSIQVTAGTISSVGSVIGVGVLTSLTSGTVDVSAGTITHGTIDNGTVRTDARTTQNIPSYGTTFGGTAAGYATLIGSAAVGVGTAIWINDLSIINSKGGTITCMVGFGTALNGTSVLAKGDFGPREGIEKSYPKAVNAGMTNQDLVAYIGAAGTIDVNVSYFISA